MFRNLQVTLLFVLMAAASFAFASREDHDHHDGEHHSAFEGQPLLTLMHNMQYYVHKLGLAIDAGNGKLTGFYLHEVEEVIEAVSDIDSYEGVAISTLLASTLAPKLEALEAAIERGEEERTDAAYDGLIEGCNECHRGAHRPYILIERNRDNPYPQRFAPQP